MKSAMLITLLLASGLVPAHGATQEGTACGRLMTEAECQQHRQTLAGLREPEAIRAYLETHLALLREREVMCACASERQVQARAQYR